MSAMSDLDMIVTEGVDLVEDGMCLADVMATLQLHYEFFCEEYDFIMTNIINSIPNKIYR